ncbi:MAG: cytochrome P450 [Pseudomonadota bacterium]
MSNSESIPVGVTAPIAPLGLIESYRAARRNVLELIPASAYEQPYLKGKGRSRWIMLMDPDALQHVLLTKEDDYPKSAVLRRIMTPREGSNLIISTGEDWHRQRRAMSPAFTPRAIQASARSVTDASEKLLNRLAQKDDEIVDLFPQMVETTCDVICDLALSGREAIDRTTLTDAVNRYVETIGRISILDVLGVPNWVPRPDALKDRSRVRLDKMADHIIEVRRARGPSSPPDLLDLVIEAGQTENGLEKLEIRNNLLGFLFAGHETTALAVTWSLYLLAFDPDVQRRAQEEVDTILDGRPATGDDLPSLGYIRQILEEALRLYPPAGFLTRTAAQADQIGEHEIAKGTQVILPIYAMHRHEMLWEKPLAFDPDRFSREAVRSRHRFSYLPFGGGPRICIGAAMALGEAQIILASLLSQYSVEIQEGFTPDPRMWFTLRPGGGMPLRVRARTKRYSAVSDTTSGREPARLSA